MIDFSIERTVDNISASSSKKSRNAIFFIALAMFGALLVGDLFRVLNEDPSIIINFPQVFFAFVFIIAFFCAYLSLKALDGFPRQVASVAVITYSQYLIDKSDNKYLLTNNKNDFSKIKAEISKLEGKPYPNMTMDEKQFVILAFGINFYPNCWLFNDNTFSEISYYLMKFDGRSYSELNEDERQYLMYLIGRKIVTPRSIFGIDTLKKVYKCNSNYQFISTLNQSEYPIKIKQRILLMKLKESYKELELLKNSKKKQ